MTTLNETVWEIDFQRDSQTSFLYQAKELIGKYHNLTDDEKPTLIRVNAQGIGDAMADYLKEQGLPIEKVR